jgi:hypothetical protein
METSNSDEVIKDTLNGGWGGGLWDTYTLAQVKMLL